jgi:endonuclease YncB( thermonuclease family)
MTSRLVLEAIAAIKAGEKRRARKLLIQAVKHNSQDDDAWLVLAAVVPEKEQKIECLERALKINPQNEKAKQVLAKYKPPPSKALSWNQIMLGGLMGAVLILGTLGLCTIFRNALKDIGTPTSTPAVRSDVPVYTLLPSETSTVGEPTPTRTSIPPTNTPVATNTEGAAIPEGYPCIPLAIPISGEVINVVDGDTIEILIGSEEFRARYIGIDSPEINEPLGEQAYQFNRALVEGRAADLYFDVSEMDSYGRLLLYVFVGDIFANYEMVRSGYAQAKDYPPDTACSATFHEGSTIARQGELGIWAPEPERSPTVKPTSPPGIGNVPAKCTCKPPDLDCGDFGTHRKAQACYQYCKSLGKGDYYRLDGDDDGSACETLP